MTAYSSTDYSNSLAPCSSNGDRIFHFSYTFSGAVADGDVVSLGKIPAGFIPTGISLYTSAAVAGTAGTVKVGTNDGTTSDDDGLIASTTATSAVSQALRPVAVKGRKMVADATVFATFGGSASFGSAITVQVLVAATPCLV